jgi:hypothetical protein
VTEPLPADPTAIAQSLLDVVVATFGTASVELPTRKTLTAGGLPAWDTDQLTVSLQRVYVGLPGQERAGNVEWRYDVFSMQLMVQLVRKASATLANAGRGRLPTTDKLGADATVYFRDARLLAAAIHTWRRDRPKGTTAGGVVVPPEQQGEYLGLSGFVDVLIA